MVRCGVHAIMDQGVLTATCLMQCIFTSPRVAQTGSLICCAHVVTVFISPHCPHVRGWFGYGIHDDGADN